MSALTLNPKHLSCGETPDERGHQYGHDLAAGVVPDRHPPRAVDEGQGVGEEHNGLDAAQAHTRDNGLMDSDLRVGIRGV